jgi:hypothetical protein
MTPKEKAIKFLRNWVLFRRENQIVFRIACENEQICPCGACAKALWLCWINDDCDTCEMSAAQLFHPCGDWDMDAVFESLDNG